MNKSKCCLTCAHFDCPIIKAWVEATESPIESTFFSCSEYKEQEIPERLYEGASIVVSKINSYTSGILRR